MMKSLAILVILCNLCSFNAEAKLSITQMDFINRDLSGDTCHTSMHYGYEMTSVSAISPAMAGKKVVVTSKVTINELAACTIMLCPPEDPCCNSCTSQLLLDGIIQMQSDSIGCSGNECNWRLGCTYNEDDVVIVYGTVSADGTSILVDDSCLVGTPDSLEPSTCGAQKPGYTEVTFESLKTNVNMNGQNVMVTYFITNGDMAACTRIACPPENPCCNSCSGATFFDDIPLVTSGDNEIGCVGTECDWEANCVYNNVDIVTVYGMVDTSAGDAFIHVHDHCARNK